MRVLFIKRKVICFGFLMLIIASLLMVKFDGNALAQVYFNEGFKLYPVYRVETNQKNVAITFDAAWGADKTEQILEVLKEFDVKATFFLVGMWVEKYEKETIKIHEAGHEIGSHSNTHPDMTKLSATQMDQELKYTNEVIQNVIGDTPKLFRPPYGAYNNTLIERLENFEMRGIQWDVDTLDWKGYTPSQVISRVNQYVQNGSIILCHNNAEHVVENTRLILTTLKNKGYNFVTVGELVKDVKDVKIGVGIM